MARLVFVVSLVMMICASLIAQAQEEGEAIDQHSRDYRCPAYAQPSVAQRFDNNISFFPVAGLIGGVGLGYSCSVVRWLSTGARFAYVPPFLRAYHIVDGELTLFAWARRVQDGLFIGPRLSLGRSVSTNDRATGTTKLTVGLVAGWQWLWDNGLNLTAGLGIQRVYVVSQHNGCPEGINCGASNGPGKENQPFGRFAAGYAF